MVKPVYSIEFQLHGETALSVVLTEEVFDRICDFLEGIMDLTIGDKANAGEIVLFPIQNHQGTTSYERVDQIRKYGMIPVVRRGTKTECVFEFLEIEGYEYISIIRRGFTRKMMDEMAQNHHDPLLISIIGGR